MNTKLSINDTNNSISTKRNLERRPKRQTTRKRKQGMQKGKPKGQQN